MLLRLQKISKHFPGVVALDGVDFDLRPGEVHVLFGENGAGKSTLISLVAGVYRPTGGRIEFRGRDDRSRLGASGAPARHQRRVPGILAGAAADCRGEPVSRRRARPEPISRQARHASQGARDPRSPRLSAQAGCARRLSVAGRAADGGDRQGVPLGLVGAHPGRADGLADRARDAAPVQPDRAGEAPAAWASSTSPTA